MVIVREFPRLTEIIFELHDNLLLDLSKKCKNNAEFYLATKGKTMYDNYNQPVKPFFEIPTHAREGPLRGIQTQNVRRHLRCSESFQG